MGVKPGTLGYILANMSSKITNLLGMTKSKNQEVVEKEVSRVNKPKSDVISAIRATNQDLHNVAEYVVEDFQFSKSLCNIIQNAKIIINTGLSHQYFIQMGMVAELKQLAGITSIITIYNTSSSIRYN